MNRKLRKFTGSLGFLLLISLLVTQAYGQVTLSGTVTSADDNAPLPGATIVESGTTNGVVSDVDGIFNITVSDQNSVLVITYVGYLKQEFTAGAQARISAVLEQDYMNMEEVVVTAYSTKSRTEISSAVVSLKADEINQVTVNSVNDMLIGKVAGVHVQTASGQPGDASDIRIRGVSSIFSPQKPLVVVDGIIGGSYNPNDIASVSVLKDAGATGLYGSAAAAGVILITTKSGTPGQSKITASLKRGVKTPEFGNYQMMNTPQLYAYHQSLYSPALFPIARPDSLLNYDYDWLNNTYRQSSITTVNLSAVGGSEKTNFQPVGNPDAQVKVGRSIQ